MGARAAVPAGRTLALTCENFLVAALGHRASRRCGTAAIAAEGGTLGHDRSQLLTSAVAPRGSQMRNDDSVEYGHARQRLDRDQRFIESRGGSAWLESFVRPFYLKMNGLDSYRRTHVAAAVFSW